MKAGPRAERLFLTDIRDATDKVLSYTAQGWDVVENDLRSLREKVVVLLDEA